MKPLIFTLVIVSKLVFALSARAFEDDRLGASPQPAGLSISTEPLSSGYRRKRLDD